MDIITNKPAKAPLIELFPDNNITVRLLFPNGYEMSGLGAKIYRKLDNTVISDVSKQPEILVEDQLLSIIFTSNKIKLLSAPFILYIYDNDAAIISFDCVTSNKSGEYQDITTQVVIGDETIVVVNAQLNPASSWGNIQGDIENQTDLIEYLTANGLSQSEADLLYAAIVHTHTFASLTSKPTTLSGYGITDAYPLTGNPSNFLTSINSGQVISALGYTPYNSTNPNGYISSITSTLVTNALGYTPVSLSGSYADPSWITSLSKSKVGLSNVLNVAQEPAITSGTTSQYWRGDKTWVSFPTIPTNNNQLTNGANYITASSADVLTNKTGNISQWTNNSGYLTSASLIGYATETFVSSGYSPLGHTHTFASLTSKPTTLSGYGITDSYTKSELDVVFAQFGDIFTGTIVYPGYNKINWDSAFGWGDHSIVGYSTASNTQTFTNKSGNISQWTNNSGYLTGINSSQVTTALGYTPVNPNGTNLQYIAGDGSKITFPSIPTNTNQLTNGAGFISASSADTLTNKSISYSQLTGTPTIPTNANYIDLSTNQSNIAGNKSYTGSLTNLSNISASSGFARAISINPTLNAIANNDSLIGIDIDPTFNQSSFTGVINYAIKHKGDVIPSVDNSFNSGRSAFRYANVFAAILNGGVNDIVLRTNSITGLLLTTTGNILMQNGGTYTNNLAGFQLKHTITAASAIARGMSIASTLTASANNDVLVAHDIAANYTTGAFTGVTKLAIRMNEDIENTKTNGAIILKDVTLGTRQFIRVDNGAIVVSTS